MPRTSTSPPSPSSGFASSSASKHYTFTRPRTLTVKHHRHINDPSDYHVKDLFTGAILFFKRVPVQSLYSSSILTRVGTQIPWPGHLIYRVHSASSLDTHRLPRLRYRHQHCGRRFQRWGGYGTRTKRNVFIISDARTGEVMYTLRIKRRRWWLSSWMSPFRWFFNSNDGEHNNNNHHDDAQIEHIAVWKGLSTAGRPYLVLSGALHDMNFDILTSATTTTTTTTTTQQQQQQGRRRKGTGSVVGIVSKDLFDMHETLRDNGRYGVHVQAGYDCALFVLLAIVVDGLYHHHDKPASAPEKTYERALNSQPGCCKEEGVVTYNGMETTRTTTTERNESLVSAEEDSLSMSLALEHIVSCNSGESFSDILRIDCVKRR